VEGLNNILGNYIIYKISIRHYLGHISIGYWEFEKNNSQFLIASSEIINVSQYTVY
jgi:hypothetical protein